MLSGQRARRLVPAAATVALLLAVLAPPAMSAVRFERIMGFAAPGPPDR